jgi:Spy/CpxP family protein refolding chaperone
MKRKLLAASAAVLLGTATAACSQPYGGMGPGMMGGYGQGGQGYGQGQGYGPGFGPGYGTGPGMMGGYGGNGMGPGMMGGYGGYGYGPDLNAEQRAKISEIQQEFAQKHWELMGRMHQQGGPMYEAFGSGAVDEKAARKAYETMAEAQKQMFEASLQMRTKIDAVLTPEQREQMGRGWRGRGPR